MTLSGSCSLTLIAPVGVAWGLSGRIRWPGNRFILEGREGGLVDLEFSDDFRLGGFALWPLGGEDAS